MSGDVILGGACLLAAVVAIVVYVWLVVRRAQMIRLLTSLGLFLTGLALFQGPSVLAATPGDVDVRLAVTALLAAVIVQVVAAVRTRPAWSGVDRRGGAGS